MDNSKIKKLEADLWESADLLRAGSKLTSNQYCMPVLGLLFLRYAYSRFKLVEAEILKTRPMRNGRQMPVEASDFAAKSALYLPKEAQYDYLVNLPENIVAAGIKNAAGQQMNSLGEVVNNAMELVEAQTHSCYHPKHTRNSGERVAHDIYYVSILLCSCHISCRVESQGKHCCTESHAHLVGKRHEGILETIVAYARLPFAIFHTVGYYGIDGCVETREEEPCYSRAYIELDRGGVRTEEIEQCHEYSAE